VARFVVEGANFDNDAAFEFGLDCLLAGIAARIAEHP